TNKMIYDKLEIIEERLGKLTGKVKLNSAIIGVIILILVAIISRIV
ncbi:unnamed protein product, partial [marine sediment metagenome]